MRNNHRRLRLGPPRVKNPCLKAEVLAMRAQEYICLSFQFEFSVGFNRMQALRREINSRRTITPVARSQFQAGLVIMTYPKYSFGANNYA